MPPRPTAHHLLDGIAAMKAVAAEVPAGPGWAFEVKWDGMRVLAAVDRDGTVAATSTRRLDVTARFPELAELGDALDGCRAVVDGEVVVLDEAGRADFGLLQRRMHVDQPAKVRQLLAEVPVTYVAFDLLHLEGHDLRPLPYLDRRRLLHEHVQPQPHVLVPGHQEGGGAELYAAARRNGLEGLVAKRTDSPYEGRRSSAWRKCKVRRQQEVVVGGWAAGEGSRAASLGSLVVGVHDPDAPGRPLRYAGRVGTGFTDETLAQLQRAVADRATDACPFDPAPPRVDRKAIRWVRPELVAEVAFGEWTPAGHLRHPSYLGLRLDKDPADVIREPDPR